jgi:hypothetical protein
MTRACIAVLAIALLVPAMATAPAGAKTKRVCKYVKVRGHKKKQKRCYRVKVKPKPKPALKIPVAVTVLDGSQAVIDFGDDNVRTVGLTGKIRGFIPGKIQLNSDTKVTLTDGALAVAPTDIFTDGCASPPIARTNPATVITIDPTKPGTGVLKADGTVTADANVLIRVVADLRGPDGCGGATVTGGYADSAAFVHLAGKVGAGGLTSLTLASDPYALTLNGCLTPGDPTAPCTQPPTAFPTTVTVTLKVLIDLSGKPF